MRWTTAYVRHFKNYSQSNLKLPKFHSWCHHIITTIKEYGAINRFTTETYEALHKDYVKNPYRSSNRHEAIWQMFQMVVLWNYLLLLII